jgi:hypothetical protein
MAYIKVPYINPVRFRPFTDQDDMPRIDKMANNINYQRGIYANKHYRPNWLLNEPLIFQVVFSGTDYTDLRPYIVTPSGVDRVDPERVTLDAADPIPHVLNYSYTPTQEGEYYILIAPGSTPVNERYISDIFYVRANDNDLVEFQCYDYDNRYDALFYGIPRYETENRLIWAPKAYYTGSTIPGPMKNTYSIFISDPGVPKKLNAEPQDTIICDLADISFLEYKKLNRILSCDTIFVNGQPVQNVDLPSLNEIEKTDLRNLTIEFTEISTDNYVKNY